MPGVARDVLFGEHRLEGSPPLKPSAVRQDQQIATHQPAQLNRGRRCAAIGDLVGAAQNVPGALGGDAINTTLRKSRLGPSTIRVTGPPASSNSWCPSIRDRTALSWSL